MLAEASIYDFLYQLAQMMTLETIVIPAQAGIFFTWGASQKKIPACAGMTGLVGQRQ